MYEKQKTTFKTGSSEVVTECQVCGEKNIKSILFLGYLPPVNTMRKIGEKPHEQPSYPAQLMYCPNCSLAQLGLIVDSQVLFPSEYPYTSSTTKVLRDNFAELYSECSKILNLSPSDLIIDIGSNDGNLLSNFKGNHKVLGVTPEEIGRIAIERGVPTIIDYFTYETKEKIKSEYGKAKLITATNVFAHIEKVNNVVKNIIDLLTDDGVFISESHYFLDFIETLQYDTIYHEHLRYYSLQSLKFLLEKHNLEVFHVKEIPSHGGSIRVYAGKKGKHPVMNSVGEILRKEKERLNEESIEEFRRKVVKSKLELYSLLNKLCKNNCKIYGIGAPSRASTLINYLGLNEDIISAVMEIKGSHKIGKYVPGTLIPVLDENILYKDQPEYALLFSWHIADELAPKIKQKGYEGKFIIPLPEPRILEV